MIKILSFINLLRLNRPIGIFLLLWPTLWALWLSSHGMPDLRTLGIFILGVIVTRSLGCAVNDLVDRNIDSKVLRTKNRPLASKQISVNDVLCLIIALAMLALYLVFQLNTYAIKISCIALLFIFLYPFTKRFLPVPQAFLGMTFGFSILIVFAFTQSQITVDAWLLFAANAFWVLAYDSHYGIVDSIDDRKIKVMSVPLTFGKSTMNIIGACYLATFILLVTIGSISSYGVLYFVALFIAFLLAFINWQKSLLFDPKANFNAFISNNYVGFFIFVGFLSQS
jgi:4-hydroxybenzoate polyprenyltransferase